MDKEKTYNARGMCENCGYRNWPQWGVYKVGTLITDYPCPQCGCKTWKSDTTIDVGTPTDVNL